MEKITKKIAKWLFTNKVLNFPRKIIKPIFLYALSSRKEIIVVYSTRQLKVFNLIKKIKKENELLQQDNEAYQIFMAVKKVEKLDGDIAEVGTYKGSTAKLISEAKGNKVLHLFDTFEGLPDLGEMDNSSGLYKGQFSSSFKDVQNYLKKYKNVYFYKGLFPLTAKKIENRKFSFVHLDADLYESTLESIKFFYPRMNRGGIIISHNYNNIIGVRKAFDDFFKDKPEPVIEIMSSQCLIVKV